MKTYAFDFFNKTDARILAFQSARDARSIGNGYVIAASEEDLEKSNVKLGQLVELYNSLSSSPVKNFRDRPTGIKRIIALAQAKAKLVEQPKEEPMTEVAAPVKAKPEKKQRAEKAPSTGKKGRTSHFEGKTIRLNPDVKENPRREGTHGYTSMQIILNSPNGISYEDYIGAGGRRQDLAWDIAHGSVYVE